MSGHQDSPRSPSPTLPQQPPQHLETRRHAVLQDLGDTIPEVPVTWFLKNIAPRVAPDVDVVKARLVKNRHIKGKRWSLFSADPSASPSSESLTFKPLTSVIENIIECTNALSLTEPLLTFVDSPNRAPISTRSNETRPDSYFVRPSNFECPAVLMVSKSEAPLHNWDDIAVSAEYKKGTDLSDRDDNVQKIIWSMHHIMRNDPCRRFTYGITVEDTQMRIWFACRSGVFVTTAFNFITDHNILIHFVISCSYATEVDLGWDPTISRLFVDGVVQYDITVHDKQESNTPKAVFRTTRLLADFGAGALRGRGTRVFEAHRLAGETLDTTPVVIKDVWADDNRKEEGLIRQELEDMADEEDKANIQKYFLTVLHHGGVKIDGQHDHTKDLICRGHDLPPSSKFKLNLSGEQIVDHESSLAAAPSRVMARAKHASNVLYQHKIHYRIVYKEVAQPIHAITKLAEIYQVLEDATMGLKLLHKYDLVHRDISSGNILSLGGRGKVSDLEYVKHMTKDGGDEIRMGTIDFMSCEVESQKYQFRPRNLDVGQYSRRVSAGKGRDKSSPTNLFHYNPLHDLESLWWIGVWMVLYHRSSSSVQDDAEEWNTAFRQQQHFLQAFPGDLERTTRSNTLTDTGTLEYYFEDLSTDIFESSTNLLEIRNLLVSNYYLAEAEPAINPAAFKGIHEKITEKFKSAKETTGDIELRSLRNILRVSKQPRQVEAGNIGEGGNDGPGSPGKSAEEPVGKRRSKRQKMSTDEAGEQS